MKTVLILNNIRSAHNVGAMFRTAEAAGVYTIFLTGYTPAPTDRFGRARKDIAKAALGAEKIITWQAEADPLVVIEKLKKEKFSVIAIEQSPNSVDYKKFVAPDNCCFVVGNEVDGLAPEILSAADAIIEIPMAGKKESLNVSVALGVALFRVLNR